jgi:hypothetical protein
LADGDQAGSAELMPATVKASAAFTDWACPSDAQKISAEAVTNRSFSLSLNFGFCGICADDASPEAISKAIRPQFFT